MLYLVMLFDGFLEKIDFWLVGKFTWKMGGMVSKEIGEIYDENERLLLLAFNAMHTHTHKPIFLLNKYHVFLLLFPTIFTIFHEFSLHPND